MVINRLHPEIRKKPTPNYEQYIRFQTVGKKRVYFSAGAVNNLDIEEGAYAHFEIINHNAMLVWFNYDKNGFRLYRDNTSGLWISNRSLVELVNKKWKIEKSDRFYIGKSASRKDTLMIIFTKKMN